MDNESQLFIYDVLTCGKEQYLGPPLTGKIRSYQISRKDGFLRIKAPSLCNNNKITELVLWEFSFYNPKAPTEKFKFSFSIRGEDTVAGFISTFYTVVAEDTDNIFLYERSLEECNKIIKLDFTNTLLFLSLQCLCKYGRVSSTQGLSDEPIKQFNNLVHYYTASKTT